MVRTIFFFAIMWLSLLASILLFLPFPLFLIPGLKRTRGRYVYLCTSGWAGLMLRLTGSKVTVTGKEHIPAVAPFVIISNHQGYMDIPLLMRVFPYPLSFVAKKELLKVPIINLWLLALDCIMIERSRALQSYKRLATRLKKGKGNPVLLFPEGTRSRGPVEGKFKKGGLKLVEDSGVPWIFVSIEDSYKIWEESGRIKPARIRVILTHEIKNNKIT